MISEFLYHLVVGKSVIIINIKIFNSHFCFTLTLFIYFYKLKNSRRSSSLFILMSYISSLSDNGRIQWLSSLWLILQNTRNICVWKKHITFLFLNYKGFSHVRELQKKAKLVMAETTNELTINTINPFQHSVYTNLDPAIQPMSLKVRNLLLVKCTQLCHNRVQMWDKLWQC